MSTVVGRFAPSPSGPLHLGSLLAALASYLQARAQGGRWLLRIDDVDTPRVKSGAERRIVQALNHYGLRWDGTILRQSTREAAYGRAIDRLKALRSAFDCGCTRREARAGKPGLEGPIYPGTCRGGLPEGRTPRSVRFRVDDRTLCIDDRIQGLYRQTLDCDIGDFVIRRADGIVAYQLATVLDDHEQVVTEIVRGADLLSSTPRQLAIYQALDFPIPHYAHLPLLVDGAGEKLGKSTGAPPLDGQEPARQLFHCLDLLGQQPPDLLRATSVGRVLRWATDNWSLEAVPRKAQVVL